MGCYQHIVDDVVEVHDLGDAAKIALKLPTHLS